MVEWFSESELLRLVSELRDGREDADAAQAAHQVASYVRHETLATEEYFSSIPPHHVRLARQVLLESNDQSERTAGTMLLAPGDWNGLGEAIARVVERCFGTRIDTREVCFPLLEEIGVNGLAAPVPQQISRRTGLSYSVILDRVAPNGIDARFEQEYDPTDTATACIELAIGCSIPLFRVMSVEQWYRQLRLDPEVFFPLVMGCHADWGGEVILRYPQAPLPGQHQRISVAFTDYKNQRLAGLARHRESWQQWGGRGFLSFSGRTGNGMLASIRRISAQGLQLEYLAGTSPLPHTTFRVATVALADRRHTAQR